MFPNVRFLTITLYMWGHIIAVAAITVFYAWYLKKYRINAAKAFVLATLIPSFTISAMCILSNFDSAGGYNWVRAVVVMPGIIYMLSLTVDLPFAKAMDFAAPGAAIHHGIDHIFCIFAGCCQGYPSAFGLWNEEKRDYLFPVQLFESASSLLIGLFMVWYAKKKNYKTHGISYAQFLFLFGLTRTFWEFFRDNTPQRWQISTFQYWSFTAFLLGTIWIGIIFYLQKHPEFVEKHELFFRDDVGELTRIKMFLRKRKKNR